MNSLTVKSGNAVHSSVRPVQKRVTSIRSQFEIESFLGAVSDLLRSSNR